MLYRLHSHIYRQATGKCTLTRDEMQGRLTDLDDIHCTLCGDDMPNLRKLPKHDKRASVNLYCDSDENKNRNPFVSELRFLFGGEGEIRTLEPFYRLHDFQSCALDQLGDFSKVI